MGGAEVQSWLLAVELARRGHDVTYVCESLAGSAGIGEVREGVMIVWLPRQPHLELLNSCRYYRTLARLRPDLVIQRFTCFYTGVAAAYCRRHRVPFFWTCTDNGLPFRTAFRRQQSRLSDAYLVGLHKRAILYAIAAVNDVSKNYGIRAATLVLTQNQFQEDSIRREFGLNSRRFPSGHPVPSRPGEKDTPPVVLWVGDISLKKRPELFLELAEACRDLDVRFAMICKAPSAKDRERAARLESYAAENPKFTWLGALSLEQTNGWFARSALYVSTSAPEGDGFPNTFVQAWLRETPVLSFGTDPDGIVDRLGIWRVVTDVGSARLAIQQYLGMSGRASVGTFARDHAVAHHSIESVADLALAYAASHACT